MPRKIKAAKNQYPEPLVGPTGWSDTTAVQHFPCKCGSDPGYHCQTPDGKQYKPPHTSRIKKLLPHATRKGWI